MKYKTITLGCKVNQYETQAMETLLGERGHVPCPEEESADLCIINSCSVTAESDRKSRQAVRRLRRQNPGAVIALCGCYSQTRQEEARGLEVDIISGSGGRAAFVEQIERFFADRRRSVELDTARGRTKFESLPSGGVSGRTRAMLKVQDGCDNFCSYCIIPYARGPVRSLEAGAAVREAEELALRGYREIVITGIEISSYGVDLPDKTGLARLTERVCLMAPNVRVRLGSLEPRTVTEEFCFRLKGLSNLCAHFHLSLQSGCDATLRRMSRKYSTLRFFGCVSLLREHFPGCAITTDLICGFPGETEEEFSQTLEFIEKCGFAMMHIFPYSERPGTPAAEMPGQVHKSVRAARATLAAELAARMRAEYLSGCVGGVLNVLFESEESGASCGHAPNYAQVSVPAQNLRGEVRSVIINGTDGKTLSGELT